MHIVLYAWPRPDRHAYAVCEASLAPAIAAARPAFARACGAVIFDD